MMGKKTIHKFVDCEDNFTAEIYCEYDDETKEVLEESVIFANEEEDYSTQSVENREKEDRLIKRDMLEKLPRIFKPTECNEGEDERRGD